MQEPFSSDVPVLPFLSIKLNCVMLLLLLLLSLYMLSSTLYMLSSTELWLQHMFHHIWSLQACIVQMGSDLMVSQLSLGSVANFWCGMQRVRILLHLLTQQLLQSKLEQLLNRQKKRRRRSINTLTLATFSL